MIILFENGTIELQGLFKNNKLNSQYASFL